MNEVRSALRVELSYLYGQIESLELLEQYGCQGWFQANQVVNAVKEDLSRQAAAAASEINEVNAVRKADHKRLGGVIEALEAEVKRLVGDCSATSKRLKTLKK